MIESKAEMVTKAESDQKITKTAPAYQMCILSTSYLVGENRQQVNTFTINSNQQAMRKSG